MRVQREAVAAAAAEGALATRQGLAHSGSAAQQLKVHLRRGSTEKGRAGSDSGIGLRSYVSSNPAPSCTLPGQQGTPSALTVVLPSPALRRSAVSTLIL